MTRQPGPCIASSLPASLLVLALGAASFGAQAEAKTDGLWRGSGGAALSMTSGNSEATSLALTLSMSNQTLQDKTTLGAAYNYGRGKTAGVSTTTNNKWNAFGQYDYNLGPRVYGFGRLGGEGDQLAKLDLRANLSGGLGYKLVDTPSTSFNVFGGLGYTSDRYSVLQTIDGRSATRFSRSSVVLGEESSHKLSDNTRFSQRFEHAIGVTGDKARLSKFTAALSVAMSRSMSLAVGLTANHNSAPPNGQKSTDTLLFTGVNLKLGAD